MGVEFASFIMLSGTGQLVKVGRVFSGGVVDGILDIEHLSDGLLVREGSMDFGGFAGSEVDLHQGQGSDGVEMSR